LPKNDPRSPNQRPSARRSVLREHRQRYGRTAPAPPGPIGLPPSRQPRFSRSTAAGAASGRFVRQWRSSCRRLGDLLDRHRPAPPDRPQRLPIPTPPGLARPRPLLRHDHHPQARRSPTPFRPPLRPASIATTTTTEPPEPTPTALRLHQDPRPQPPIPRHTRVPRPLTPTNRHSCDVHMVIGWGQRPGDDSNRPGKPSGYGRSIRSLVRSPVRPLTRSPWFPARRPNPRNSAAPVGSHGRFAPRPL
jgi:hypothetical protein